MDERHICKHTHVRTHRRNNLLRVDMQVRAAAIIIIQNTHSQIAFELEAGSGTKMQPHHYYRWILYTCRMQMPLIIITLSK